MPKKTLLITLLIVILTGGIVAGGLYIGKQASQTKKEIEETGLQESATPPSSETERDGETSPAEIDTSHWRTYRNEKFGYEIKYPEDWKIKEASHLIRWDSPIQTPEKRFIFIRMREPSTSEEIQCIPSVLASGERILGKVMVNNSEFCKTEYKIDGIQEIFYLLIKDDMGYDVGLAVYNRKSANVLPEKEIEFELKILNQMLPTFKFIR